MHALFRQYAAPKALPALLLSGIAYAVSTAPAVAAATPDFDYDAYTRSVEQVQAQQMQQFIRASQRLNQQAQTACSGAGTIPLSDWQALPELQQQWQSAYQQWQRLQVFPLGPNNDVTVRLNISFWPDKKNLIERKARNLLRQGEDAQLEHGGIALQGLTASEYLLFDPGHLQRSTPAESCHLLTRITDETHRNAQKLLTRWQKSEFLSHWHDAALGNESFASTKQATGYLLDGLAQTLEQIAKYKLYKPFRLNDPQAAPNPYLAENWRSDQGLISLQTNISQIRDYYLGLPPASSGQTATQDSERINGPDQLLRYLGFAGEADQIRIRFIRVQEVLDQLKALGTDAYASQNGKAIATELHQQIKQLEQALKKPLPHFKLAQRFNSTDGD